MGTAISCNVAHCEPHPLQREEGSGHAVKGVASIVHVAVVVHTEVKRLKYFLCVANQMLKKLFKMPHVGHTILIYSAWASWFNFNVQRTRFQLCPISSRND